MLMAIGSCIVGRRSESEKVSGCSPGFFSKSRSNLVVVWVSVSSFVVLAVSVCVSVIVTKAAESIH